MAFSSLGAMTFPGLDVDAPKLRDVCGRSGVSRLEVFGSVGRGETSPGSDIDVLYELAPGARLGWNIETLADELSVLLGRRVDLFSRSSLPARLHPQVLAEARPLYAA